MKHLYRIILMAAVAAISFSNASAQNKTMATFVELPKAHGEICLGLTIQPQVLFSNVTASTQHLKAQITIVNAVTGQSLYSSSLNILNVPANSDTLVTFPNFVTNINEAKFLGRHVVTAIGSSMTSGGTITPDSNPADDTLRVTVFGTRRTQMPYDDHSGTYTVTTTGLVVPTATKWVVAGATVVDGDDHTFDPPSPRDPDSGYGTLLLTSPVIKMDRKSVNGVMYSEVGSGDTLTSFPVNLLGASNINLSFDYHRSSKRMYPLAFDKDSMHGPEHTVKNALNNVARAGDSLIIEFKNPSESACNPSSGSWMRVAAIDAAYDFEWQRFFISVDSRNKVNLNFFNSDFRFRIRLQAKDDAIGTNRKDDEDAWYIDNIRLSTPVAEPQTRVNWVRVVSPYTKVPSRQAVFPVYVKITNDASTLTTPAQVVVQITGPDGTPKYHQVMFVKRPAVGRDTIVAFPYWDASNTIITPLDREVKVQAWIHSPGFESYASEYDAYSSFFVNVEPGSSNTQEFAYDDAGITPVQHGGNDVPAIRNAPGQGIGFNNHTGSFAMRFTLHRSDTLYGARLYFGRANASNDPIRIRVYDGSPESPYPLEMVNNPAASLDAERGTSSGDQYFTYYFNSPIVLPGVTDGDDGHYWIVVSQLSLDNMCLGADASRAGADLMVSDNVQPVRRYVHRSPFATQFEATRNAGSIENRFAIQMSAGIDDWISLDPNSDIGIGANTGGMIPMIRALVGRRGVLPVAYAQQLKAEMQDGKALLTWVTANEKNNHGFHVERKIAGGEWSRLGFVSSRYTNSATPSGYAFEDNSPASGRITYRLTQVDLDGTEALSNEAELFIGENTSSALQIYPNPAVNGQSVTVVAPVAAPVTVTNVLGQIVRTIEPTTSTFTWDARDNAGKALPAGNYILQIGEYSKMIVVN